MSKKNLTDDEISMIREIISRLSMYIKEKKISEGTLTDQATGGFNLACDFISDDLRKMADFDTSKLLAMRLK